MGGIVGREETLRLGRAGFGGVIGVVSVSDGVSVSGRMFSLEGSVGAGVCLGFLVCFTGTTADMTAGRSVAVLGASFLLPRARSGTGFMAEVFSVVLARTRPLLRWCFSSSRSPWGFCRVTRLIGSLDCDFGDCTVDSGRSGRSSCGLFRFCGAIFKREGVGCTP